jgi:hypothetical protein
MAFRMAYSLLDKVAYFLNDYLALSIPERKVNFRSFWYDKQERKRGLLPGFEACDNWPLRGLFWLSKGLFEDAPKFRECLEPDAQELDSVRNHAEHKYLKLHENLWSGPTDEGMAFGGRPDRLAFSLYRSHFAAKALRLLTMARAAIMYSRMPEFSASFRARDTRPGDCPDGRRRSCGRPRRRESCCGCARRRRPALRRRRGGRRWWPA